jgi:hypothetical protein
MSSTINSSGPSNSMQSFDVQKVLETLRTPLELLKILVEKDTRGATRTMAKAISTPTEDSQALRQENPYRGKTLQTILSENSSEPLEDKDFLDTVKQIKDTCIEHEISDNHSLFDQLEKLHLTKINSTDTQPYARLTEEIRLGIIATGAKEVLGRLATEGHTEAINNLVKVLKLIAQELSTASLVPVDNSLVGQFESAPRTSSSGKHIFGRPASSFLTMVVKDPQLSKLQQHDVRIFLKSAQDWRAENGGQLADNSQSKETSAKNTITDFFSRRLF